MYHLPLNKFTYHIMRKIFTLLFLSVLITGQAFAQVNRCSTVEHEAVLRAKYPDYDAKRAAIEAYTQQYTKKNNILAKAEGADDYYHSGGISRSLQNCRSEHS
jgi:energy-converting hydrogenase Eha subunit F